MGLPLFSRFAGLGIASLVAGLAVPACAAPAPTTRLVSCGTQSCLLVAGRRDSAASTVAINGHPVAVEGRRSWHVRLPLPEVRALAAPYARTIAVTVTPADGRVVDGRIEDRAEASLPIGLMGHVTNLAALVVRAR
jgi:hypothetical protein